MKPITRERLETMKKRAVSFLQNVAGDPTRAAEVDAESLQQYADRKGLYIENPGRKTNSMTVKELNARVKELEEQVEDLSDTITKINDIASDAYTPEATRSSLAAAMGSILELSDVEEEDEDSDDEDDDEEDSDDEDE